MSHPTPPMPPPSEDESRLAGRARPKRPGAMIAGLVVALFAAALTVVAGLLVLSKPVNAYYADRAAWKRAG